MFSQKPWFVFLILNISWKIYLFLSDIAGIVQPYCCCFVLEVASYIYICNMLFTTKISFVDKQKVAIELTCFFFFFFYLKWI